MNTVERRWGDARRDRSGLNSSGTQTLLTRKGWFRFGFAFLLLGLSALVAASSIETDSWWMHGLWCVLGLTLVIRTLGRIFRVGFTVVLLDHRVMFTASFALYFLVGAAQLAFGSEAEIADSLRNYSLDAEDAVRMNALNAIGFGLALMTSAVSSARWLRKQADRVAKFACHVPRIWVMIMLMAVGMLASFNVLMVDFALREQNVAGIWRAASHFLLVVIFLGSTYRGRHESVLLLTAVFFAVIGAISGTLLFSKTAMLLPIGALTAGLSVRYGVRKVLPGGLLLMIVLFGSVGGAVLYGRDSLTKDVPHSLDVRWHTFMDGLTESYSGANQRDEYNTWGRLCYLSPQVAAYNFYNMGMGGDDLKLIPWLFVPRVLAPDKPSITDSGLDLNEKITGGRFSSMGQGIFSSGYYNAGWLGVLLASIICGWILAQTSAIASAIFGRHALLLLPFALAGVYMAFRIDGHFVADYMGTFVFMLYPILFFSGLLALQARRA